MEPTKTTARDIRRHNRSSLLSTLFFSGPLSRMELGELTGLSSGTVSTVTAELLGQGLIVEAGQVDSDGGRPRTLLRVNPGYGHVIGADVGETGVLVEVFDLGMERRATVMEPLPPGPPDPVAVADQIVAGVRTALATSGLETDDLLGLGIGVPGTVQPGQASEPPLVHAPTVGWKSVALTELLRERGLRMPLFLDNGARTLGQAEMWFGSGRGARHAVIALVGSGVGVALITDGVSYRGTGRGAGEWGHTTIALDGRPCRCGSSGCLEAYVGAEAVLARYRELAAGRADQPQVPAEEMAGFAALLAAADSPLAGEVLAETARLLGIGLANLINLLNPERVVLGGWAGLALAADHFPRILAAVQGHALPLAFEQVSIELCRLGPDAVALGAATLPVAALLGPEDPPVVQRRRNRALSGTVAGPELGAATTGIPIR